MSSSLPRFTLTVDSAACMGPIICDSPAVMLSHRPRAHFAQNVPHDSATSLVRLDAGLLPSPLFNRTVSTDLLTCTSSSQLGEAKLHSQELAHGTHVVPMIISPDEHHTVSHALKLKRHMEPHGLKVEPHMDPHGLQLEQPEGEEEFVLHSIALSSPSTEAHSGFESDSPPESPFPASPDSPCDRSLIPNSAPGFVLSPSPQAVSAMLYSSMKSSHKGGIGLSTGPRSAQQDSVALSFELGTEDAEEQEVQAAAVVDIDSLNSLLK